MIKNGPADTLSPKELKDLMSMLTCLLVLMKLVKESVGIV